MEGVGALVDWAKKQKNVLYVIAEIEKDNIASIKVAENIGMVKYKETEENFYYKKCAFSDFKLLYVITIENNFM